MWTSLPAAEVDVAARELLGWELAGNGVRIRLTEVEAYAGLGTDPASHAHRGRTPRNAVMFGPPGVAYVYHVYGMHWCLNVVTGAVGEASAILLRAGAALSGIDLARSRRGGAGPDREIARGPARLTVAMGIDARANGTSLLDGSGPLLLTPPEVPVEEALIRSGPRVGVASAHDTPWRFWLDGEPSVSAYRRHVARGARATPPPR